jgi:hypothetical protein
MIKLKSLEDVIEALSWNLSIGPKENHEISQSRLFVFGLFLDRSRSPNRCTAVYAVRDIIRLLLLLVYG